MNLSSVYTPNRLTFNNLWFLSMLGISLIGLVDSSYLTINHFSGEIPSCSDAAGCDEVLNGPFATIGPLPVALFGVLFYATTLALTVASKIGNFGNWLKAFTALGFIISCYLMYLQISVINATCQYCVISFATSTFLFALSWIQPGAREATNRRVTH